MAKARYTQPKDRYGEPIEGAVPMATALASTVKTLAAPYNHTLNDNTRLITVYAISKDVFVKWANDSEEQAAHDDFDEIVIAGTEKIIAVPEKVSGQMFDYVSVAGREAGASAVIVEK